MDTAWFAVDRDGHVAVFETGEAGAAPKEAYLGEDYFELLDALQTGEPRGAAVFDLAGYRRSHARPHVEPREGMEVLAFLRDAEPFAERLEAAGAVRVATTEGAGFMVPSALRHKALLDEIHARDLCLGCFFQVVAETPVAEHGLYRFEHTDDWISGPYALVIRPENPARIDELPRSLAENAIVFDGSFAEGPSLQPAELWESDSWGPVWLASDGRTVRPFPGREEELDEVAPELEASGEHVLVREPLAGVGRGHLYAPAKADDDAEDHGSRAASADARAPASATAPAGGAKRPWWKLW